MPMRYLFAAFCLVAFGVTPSWGKEPKVPGLNIYFVDTEGGAATLIVTPHGESVLIDCGNPGKRDAERICAATQLAGLKAIDHLIISHWHLDHYGAVEHLIKQIPIHHFYDHGIPEELKEDPKNFKVLIEAYKKASKDKSHTLKAGDEVPLKQAKGDLPLRLFCLCGSGEVIADKPGAPENPLAKEHKAKDEDKTDNARSLGFLLSFGDFRLLNLGDLTWNIEHKLVHPSDKVGLVDVYQVTHHGLDISNNPVLIKTVQPRVAIFCNGPKKGGHPSVTATLRRIDGIEAIYQMHKNLVAETHENTEAAYIANTEDSDKCKGELIKLTVAPDGKSYQVMVGANGKPKEFQTRLASRERK